MEKIFLKESMALGDGTATAEVGVENQQLVAQVSIGFPIEKVLTPLDAEIDKAMQKLKDAIPGNWEDGIVNQFKDSIKNGLRKTLGV